MKWDLDPVPTIYSKSQDIPTSLLPTISTTRKPPTVRISVLPDESLLFRQNDEIKEFNDINDSICREGYQLQLEEGTATFYKVEKNKTFGIPEITETINY